MSRLDLQKRFPSAQIYDLTKFFSEFVPFTANSVYPVHNWYRFKEGFSRDLVHLLLGTLGIKINDCLDPFGGSGTTALACQEIGIRCHSIEVNPFLHHVAKAKLSTEYTVNDFDKALRIVKREFAKCINSEFEQPIMSTLTESEVLNKWLFSRAALQAVLALRHCFNSLDQIYADLFLVILASILPDVGNTTKDGKCVRYKDGWEDIRHSKADVRDMFFERAKVFRKDIKYIEKRASEGTTNRHLCLKGSALRHLREIPDNYVDAVITSPPYLNSFDYTDVYMPEIWALGFVKNYQEVRELREATLRSHVQVKWNTDKSRLNRRVKLLISEIIKAQESLWNSAIPEMIGGYFLDMQDVLVQLNRIVRKGGKVCIVVGTSSYYNVPIQTDFLIALLAESVGFTLEEMKIVRNLKRSTQQAQNNGKSLPALRESILVLRH